MPEKKVEQERRCPKCSLGLFEHETFCPSCFWYPEGQPVPKEIKDIFWINLDDFRPIEKLIWDQRSVKRTDVQWLKTIEASGYIIEDHPVWTMIENWGYRGRHISCEHKSHDTEEKKKKCTDRQAAKIAVQTIRSHLGLLDRLVFWAQERSFMTKAMWTRFVKKQPDCPVCNAREGLVIPTSLRYIPVLHPKCHCGLIQLAAGTERAGIENSLLHVRKRNVSRADRMDKNAARSGFPPIAASGCGTFLLLTLIIVIGFWALIS
jgi:hypothetical protein